RSRVGRAGPIRRAAAQLARAVRPAERGRRRRPHRAGGRQRARRARRAYDRRSRETARPGDLGVRAAARDPAGALVVAETLAEGSSLSARWADGGLPAAVATRATGRACADATTRVRGAAVRCSADAGERGGAGAMRARPDALLSEARRTGVRLRPALLSRVAHVDEHGFPRRADVRCGR